MVAQWAPASDRALAQRLVGEWGHRWVGPWVLAWASVLALKWASTMAAVKAAAMGRGLGPGLE